MNEHQQQDTLLEGLQLHLMTQQRRPTTVAIPSFSAAIFYVALGYAPVRVETDPASDRCIWYFPAAVKGARDQYHEAKELLDEMRRRSRKGAAK